MHKKASILTFHCVPNYGAVLQTYAMQQYLKRHFESVEVVDYRPKHLTREYKYLSFYSVFSLAATAWSLPSFWRKRKKFNSFMKRRLTLSAQKSSDPKKLKLSTDVLFLGSDQIWNSQITRGLDPAYFGQIPGVEEATVVSYAASVGKAVLSEDEKAFFRNALQNIHYISVREEEAKQLLQPLTDQQIRVCADPTILAGAECFAPLIKPVAQQNYVLLYSLNRHKEAAAMATKVAKYFGLSVVEVSGRRKGVIKKDHKTLYAADPAEFLSLIANAAYVVTDSFHATVFSLLFHTKFVTIPHKTRNSRASNLLSLCDLSQRLTSVFDRGVIDRDVAWEDVDRKLAALRMRSEQFLAEAGGYCE